MALVVLRDELVVLVPRDYVDEAVETRADLDDVVVLQLDGRRVRILHEAVVALQEGSQPDAKVLNLVAIFLNIIKYFGMLTSQSVGARFGDAVIVFELDDQVVDLPSSRVVFVLANVDGAVLSSTRFAFEGDWVVSSGRIQNQLSVFGETRKPILEGEQPVLLGAQAHQLVVFVGR